MCTYLFRRGRKQSHCQEQGERGNVSVVVCALIGLIAVLTVGVARVGFVLREQALAQAAADAVALAGVRHGRLEADAISALQGVAIVDWELGEYALDVRVVRERSGQSAYARAEFIDERLPATVEWWEPSWTGW